MSRLSIYSMRRKSRRLHRIESLREPLSFALDVNDYLDFLGVSTEFMDDERLLEFMYENRSDSKFVPDEARKESRVWLAQHKPLD